MSVGKSIVYNCEDSLQREKNIRAWEQLLFTIVMSLYSVRKIEEPEKSIVYINEASLQREKIIRAWKIYCL